MTRVRMSDEHIFYFLSVKWGTSRNPEMGPGVFGLAFKSLKVLFQKIIKSQEILTCPKKCFSKLLICQTFFYFFSFLQKSPFSKHPRSWSGFFFYHHLTRRNPPPNIKQINPSENPLLLLSRFKTLLFDCTSSRYHFLHCSTHKPSHSR